MCITQQNQRIPMKRILFTVFTVASWVWSSIITRSASVPFISSPTGIITTFSLVTVHRHLCQLGLAWSTHFFVLLYWKEKNSANLRPKCVKNKYHGYVDIRPVKHSEDLIFNTLTSWYHSLWSIWTIGAKDWKYFAKLFDQRWPLQYALIKIWEIFLESFWIDFFYLCVRFLSIF